MSREKGRPATKTKKADPNRIVQATIACIEEHGGTHTGAAEVAAAAGVGRQTVYRVFPTRRLLFEAVISERLRAMAERLKLLVSKYARLEDAIISGSIKSIQMARQDPIFVAALGEIDHVSIEAYMIGPDSPLRDFMLMIWQETLTAARLRGELRQDIADVDIVDWLRGVHLILNIRQDLSPAAAGKLLKTFVMPGLLAPPNEGKTTVKRKNKTTSRRPSAGIRRTR